MIDYGRPEVANTDLDRISSLVSELKNVEARLETLAAETKDLETRRRMLAEEEIPELVLATGRRALDVASGHVEIVDEIKASITHANRADAFRWLDDHGHGGMIKRSVDVAFSKDQEERAERLRQTLVDEGYDVRVGGSVHAGTLKKWARERIEEGVDLPSSISVHRITRAKLS